MFPGQSYRSKRLKRARRDVRDRLAELATQPLAQESHQGRKILPAFPKRRERDREDVQAIEKVSPEPPAPDFLGQVAIGRGDDADVDTRHAGPAEALDLSFLEHAQDLRLQLERQLSDLVEEHGAAVGELEAARLRGVRSGERTPLAPEQFALDERRRGARRS